MLLLKKPILILLMVLNVVVLSGQIWPDAAPPFARWINILFLGSSLIFFLYVWRRKF